MMSCGSNFEGSGIFPHSLPLLRGLPGHQLGGDEQLLVHHLLYTSICRTVMTIAIAVLFSILENSFISTYEFYFVSFFFSPSSLPLPTGKGEE